MNTNTTPIKQTERIVPPKITTLIQAEFRWKPTWKERLKIFIGYKLKFTYQGYAAHSPGRVDHKMKHEWDEA